MRFLTIVMILMTAVSAQMTVSVTPPIMVSNSSKYDSFGVPGLIKANNGNLLWFYREGTTHANERGPWLLRISTNNGKSWIPYSGANYCAPTDPPGCVFAGPVGLENDLRNIAGGVAPDGSIIVLLLYMRWSYFLANNYQAPFLMTSRSTDNGASWSAPTMINKDGNTCDYNAGIPVGTCYWAYAYGQLIATPNGLAIVTEEMNHTGSYPLKDSLYLIWSYDNGITWGVTVDGTHPGYTLIPPFQGYSLDCYEMAMVYTHSQLLGVCRSGFDENRHVWGGSLQFFKSADFGITWSHSQGINLPNGPIPARLWNIGYTGIYNDIDYSPWIIDPKLPSGNLLLLVPERMYVTNGTVNQLVVYLRQMTFDPVAVLADPLVLVDAVDRVNHSFPISQILVNDPLQSGSADFGYPSAVVTSSSLTSIKILIAYHGDPQPPTYQKAQLWQMRVQYLLPDPPFLSISGGVSVK